MGGDVGAPSHVDGTCRCSVGTRKTTADKYVVRALPRAATFWPPIRSPYSRLTMPEPGASGQWSCPLSTHLYVGPCTDREYLRQRFFCKGCHRGMPPEGSFHAGAPYRLASLAPTAESTGGTVLHPA
eukprot:scaffold1172_cov409-Prasinococcus_capsulatus_cf.AAC.6